MGAFDKEIVVLLESIGVRVLSAALGIVSDVDAPDTANVSDPALKKGGR